MVVVRTLLQPRFVRRVLLHLGSSKPTLFQQLKRKAPAEGINWTRLGHQRQPTDDKTEVSWI
jgi:hypothetical protein